MTEIYLSQLPLIDAMLLEPTEKSSPLRPMTPVSFSLSLFSRQPLPVPLGSAGVYSKNTQSQRSGVNLRPQKGVGFLS